MMPDCGARDRARPMENYRNEMKQAAYRLDAKHDFLPRHYFLVFRPATAGR